MSGFIFSIHSALSPLQQCSIQERIIPEINKTENNEDSSHGRGHCHCGEIKPDYSSFAVDKSLMLGLRISLALRTPRGRHLHTVR